MTTSPFTKPLLIHFSRQRDGIIEAINYEYDAYGYGKTDTEAGDDLRDMLIDELKALSKDEARLSGYLAARLIRLRALMAPLSHAEGDAS